MNRIPVLQCRNRPIEDDKRTNNLRGADVQARREKEGLQDPKRVSQPRIPARRHLSIAVLYHLTRMLPIALLRIVELQRRQRMRHMREVAGDNA